MNSKIIKTRLRKLRKLIYDQGLDFMIVTNQQNVTYLSGFLGHDSWMLVGPDTYLITDSRYTEQAKSECSGCHIVERKDPLQKTVAKILDDYINVDAVGIEKTCTLQAAGMIKKAMKCSVKAVSGLVESLREIKDPSEVKLISKAAQFGWEILAKSLVHLRIGMSESELSGHLEFQIRKAGLRPGFETIVAFGPNGSRNHHQPGQRKLHKIDTVLIDFGICYKGYTSDITRCFAVGKPTKKYTEAYYTVLKAQKEAIKKIKAGEKTQNVDKAARQVISDTRFPVYGHGTGHGLGLAVHETPVMATSTVIKGILQAGQVITIEPGIYIPGEFGIRIEDDILVTKDGSKVISKDTQLGFSNDKLPVL